MTDRERDAERELAAIQAAKAAASQVTERLDTLDAMVRQRALRIETDVRARRRKADR